MRSGKGQPRSSYPQSWTPGAPTWEGRCAVTPEVTKAAALTDSELTQQPLAAVKPPRKPSLGEGSANFLCKGLESKDFQLCRSCCLHHKYPILPSYHESSQRQYGNQRTWLCSNKTYKRQVLWLPLGSENVPQPT